MLLKNVLTNQKPWIWEFMLHQCSEFRCICQTNSWSGSQGLAGSRAAVHYWWNIPPVLLKSNLWECSSAGYCHPHPSYTARGHSGSSPQGHNSPKQRLPLHWAPPEWHNPPFTERPSPFSHPHLWLLGLDAPAKTQMLSQSITTKDTSVTDGNKSKRNFKCHVILRPFRNQKL